MDAGGPAWFCISAAPTWRLADARARSPDSPSKVLIRVAAVLAIRAEPSEIEWPDVLSDGAFSSGSHVAQAIQEEEIRLPLFCSRSNCMLSDLFDTFRPNRSYYCGGGVSLLIRFEVENFRSVLDPAELSLVAVDGRTEAREFEKLGAALLTTAGIFGPNASGKSNVLASLSWLREAVANSLRMWEEVIPTEPFAFEEGRKRPSSFALELMIRGVRFEYLLELDQSHVSLEALFHYPEGRRRRIFERDGNELILQRGFGVLSGTRSLLTDRSLALTIMRRFDEPATSDFARTFLNMTSLGQPVNRFRRPPAVLNSTLRLFGQPQVDQEPLFDFEDEPSESERERAMALLRLADLGVADVQVEETKVEGSGGGNYTRRVPQLIHRSETEAMPFDYRNESAGTRTWFELIGPVLQALDRGTVVLFDELDASLHPTLTVQLLHLFQSRGSNPRGAQLLFTSHDTNLLNHLNRDEVWLTQKDRRGSTRFAALADFAGERVRKSRNIETGYLSGRFGALPDVMRPDVLRDLGLIG
jgi:uncharacterized protein